jgi:Gas vesicle synthesis protein GvpL/GvpF
VLYVYALVDARDEAPLPARGGHGGAPLCAVARGPVVAVCSRHEQLDLPADKGHLWHHEQVTEALMEHHAVLPVRFGTTVADDDALAAMLDDRRTELCAALARVRGRVEIAVRALWTPPEATTDGPEPGSGPGRAYLLARLEARNAASALAESIHGELAAHAVEARDEVLTTPSLLLSAAYLVERGGVDAFLEVVDDVARRHPEVEILCTGPWPAHTFAVAAGGAA